MALQALIFDVDGTLAETEEMHREAFNQAFASFGLGWNWAPPLYKELLRITGGKERILHYLKRDRPPGATAVERKISQIYALKTKFYSAMVREGTLALRPGVARLIDRRAGVFQLTIPKLAMPQDSKVSASAELPNAPRRWRNLAGPGGCRGDRSSPSGNATCPCLFRRARDPA
jgi:Haloacid dehalogenase-like hydrolase